MITAQLWSYILLAATVGMGLVWYERTRPSAKLVALVAALAALATIGRIAFAPLPGVKPTTDIILIAGFVLGGPAGLGVGMVTALASSFVFGLGPWTAWQMAAWGVVGLAGAGLATTTGGRIGRVPLALACAAAGLLFGAIADLSTWSLVGGQHPWAAYLATAAASLWFNVAHAVGNFVFALTCGPMLIRTLRRYRLRSEVEWLEPGQNAAE